MTRPPEPSLFTIGCRRTQGHRRLTAPVAGFTGPAVWRAWSEDPEPGVELRHQRSRVDEMARGERDGAGGVRPAAARGPVGPLRADGAPGPDAPAAGRRLERPRLGQRVDDEQAAAT